MVYFVYQNKLKGADSNGRSFTQSLRIPYNVDINDQV
jgi:hypothetical protein